MPAATKALQPVEGAAHAVKCRKYFVHRASRPVLQRMERRFKVAKFHPWVGEHYDDSNLGSRLLVLGESHYRWVGMPDKRELTTIEALKASRHKHSFWRGLASLIGTHGRLEGSSLWDHVAFYNYVQHIVGTGARQRPDERFWTSPQTVNAFKEVLSI